MSHAKRCGRCGHPVEDASDEDGQPLEECICLMRYDGEPMPSAWYFEYKTSKPA